MPNAGVGFAHPRLESSGAAPGAAATRAATRAATSAATRVATGGRAAEGYGRRRSSAAGTAMRRVRSNQAIERSTSTRSSHTTYKM